MNRIIKVPLILLLMSTVAACDTTAVSTGDTPSQRDVYVSVDDCIKDWGDTDLCEKTLADAKEAKEAAAKIAQAGGGSGTSSVIPVFMGPSYTPGARYANYNGQQIVPNTQRAVATSNFTRTASGLRTAPKFTPPSPISPPSVISRNTPRGGFGATGAARSSGSSGS